MAQRVKRQVLLTFHVRLVHATKNETAKLIIYFGHIAIHVILGRKEERLKRRMSNFVPGGIGRPMERESRLKAISQPEKQLHTQGRSQPE